MHRSRSHDPVIRVYDDGGNVIETHEHQGMFKTPAAASAESSFLLQNGRLLYRNCIAQNVGSWHLDSPRFVLVSGELIVADHHLRPSEEEGNGSALWVR